MARLEALDCPKCGGSAADHEQPFCGYCGAALERTREVRSPREEELERLARAEREAHRVSATDRRAVTRRAPVGNTSGLVRSVVVLVALTWVVLRLSWLPIRIGAGVIALLHVFSLVARVRERRRYASAKLERVAVFVRDERAHVSGDGESTSTEYFVSIERRNGVRSEYGITAELAARIAPGDVGVAFLRDDRLLDFVRVEQP